MCAFRCAVKTGRVVRMRFCATDWIQHMADGNPSVTDGVASIVFTLNLCVCVCVLPRLSLFRSVSALQKRPSRAGGSQASRSK